MGAINKLGTQVRLPDGRLGTVVFNGLTGVGIKWGLHDPPPEEFEGTCGDLFAHSPKPDDWPWKPDAMLRDPKLTGNLGMPCVCDESEVKILREGLNGPFLETDEVDKT